MKYSEIIDSEIEKITSTKKKIKEFLEKVNVEKFNKLVSFKDVFSFFKNEVSINEFKDLDLSYLTIDDLSLSNEYQRNMFVKTAMFFQENELITFKNYLRNFFDFDIYLGSLNPITFSKKINSVKTIKQPPVIQDMEAVFSIKDKDYKVDDVFLMSKMFPENVDDNGLYGMGKKKGPSLKTFLNRFDEVLEQGSYVDLVKIFSFIKRNETNMVCENIDTFNKYCLGITYDISSNKLLPFQNK